MTTLLARTTSILALLSATLAAPEAAAQSTLQAGDSVLITWYGLSRSSVYQVVRVAPDTLVVTRMGTIFELPMAGIQRIAVPTRRTRLGQVGHDALIGGLIGAAGGAILGLASGNPDCAIVCFTATERALMAGTALGVLGAGAGALTGAIRSPGLTWRAIPLPGLRVGMMPTAAGVRLAATWRR